MPRILLCLLLLLCAADCRAADTFPQHLQQAAQTYEQQKPQAALDSLREATAALWEKLPFSALKVSLLRDMPSPQGGYALKADANYQIGDALIIYFEPVGFKVRQEGGLYLYHLEVDFNLKDAFGHLVASQQRFSSISGPALSFPDRLSMVVSYNLTGLTPGDYHLETRLRDVAGKCEHIIKNIIHVQSAAQHD